MTGYGASADNRRARDRATEMTGLASDSSGQTLFAASISAPICGGEWWVVLESCKSSEILGFH
jgi:hypothetical protein